MKILVTGSSGFIGGSICIEAKALGHEIVGVDKQKKEYLLPFIDEFIHGDFSNEYLLHFLRNYQPDVVIHCAGSIRVDESVSSPSKYYINNVTKTITFLNMITEVCPKTHFMFSSTGSIYQSGNNLTETSIINPITPYAKTKVMVEDIIQDYASAYNLKFTIFRYFNACGSIGSTHGQLPKSPHLFARMFEDESISLFGINYDTPDGTCIRDYIHVRDIAQAHLFCMDKNITGVYNIGQGKGYSNNQIIDEYIIRVGVKAIKYLPNRPGDPVMLVSSIDKIKELGWQSSFSLYEIFSDLKKWYKSENYKGLVDGKVYFN